MQDVIYNKNDYIGRIKHTHTQDTIKMFDPCISIRIDFPLHTTDPADSNMTQAARPAVSEWILGLFRWSTEPDAAAAAKMKEGRVARAEEATRWLEANREKLRAVCIEKENERQMQVDAEEREYQRSLSPVSLRQRKERLESRRESLRLFREEYHRQQAQCARTERLHLGNTSPSASPRDATPVPCVNESGDQTPPRCPGSRNTIQQITEGGPPTDRGVRRRLAHHAAWQ